MKKSDYLTLLNTSKGRKIDLSFELFQIISTEKSQKDKIEALEFLCEHTIGASSDGAVEVREYYTDAERTELKNTIGAFVDSVLKYARLKAYREHFEPIEFYKLLWDMIFNNGSLNSEKENAFALYWILIDRFIPYVYLDDKLNISLDVANNFIDSNLLSAHRMRYIVSFPLGKHTICSSLIMQELEAANSMEDKAILLAYAMSELEQFYMKRGEDDD